MEFTKPNLGQRLKVFPFRERSIMYLIISIYKKLFLQGINSWSFELGVLYFLFKIVAFKNYLDLIQQHVR